MKDEAIEICSFRKLTLISEKLFFSFFFKAVTLVFVLNTEQDRSMGSQLLATLPK